MNAKTALRMQRAPWRGGTLPLFLVPVLMLLAACAEPLGPGFEIQRQELTFEHTGGERAQVRSVYRIRNAGNQPLEQLEILLPPGLSGFRGEVKDQPGTVRLTETGKPARDPGEALERAGAVARFSPPVERNRRFELVVEFSVSLGVPAGSDSIHLPAARWFPALVRPATLFARGGARGKDVRLSIRVPHGWRVLAPGRSQGVRRGEYRFRVREDDVEPYLLAGAYTEQTVAAHGQKVIFWTLSPADSSMVQSTGARLAQTVEFFETTLGPREVKERRPVFVIEQQQPNFWRPADAGDPDADESEPPPPGVARFPSQPPDFDFGNEMFRRTAEADFAYTWLGHLARPESEEEVRLAAVLGGYLVRLAAGARGEAVSGRENLADLIGKFDASLELVRAMGENDAGAGEILAPWKQILFVIALEDRLGREKLNAGLRRMLQARRGDTWNRLDLRAALELESGQDLSELFRQWAGTRDIPDEFRARYAGKDQP